MKRAEILDNLERVIRKRNPLLADQLRPALSPSHIARHLKKIIGATESLFDLYGWHDGTEPVRTVSGETHNTSLDELAFFPKETFYFVDLETAVSSHAMWAEAAKYRPELKSGAGRLFPLFWDGSTAYLALDLQAQNGSITFFENESDEPFRPAYTTLDEFLIDALRANETGEPLRFFSERLE